jgi:hypothetical protein
MPNIQGLAWDDKPEDYMDLLKVRLARAHVDLEVHKKPDEFYDALDNGRWDFVVVDVFDESRGKFDPVGLELAQRAAEGRPPWYPVFVLTARVEQLLPEHWKRLPRTASLRYKSDPVSLAYLIKDELVQRGVFVDRNRVFFVHSCAEGSGIRTSVEMVRRWLQDRRVQVEELKPGNIRTEIGEGLLAKMNSCAAIVVLCTADDEHVAGVITPRPNVLLEAGIAMGMARGLERLIVVKQKPVTLPSDLGGVLYCEFDESVNEAFVEFEDKLINLDVRLSRI